MMMGTIHNAGGPEMGKKKAKKNVQEAAKKHEEIIRKYKKKKALNFISTLIIFGAAFFAVWFTNNRATIPDETTRTVMVAAICAITLGALAFSFFNWRCPACGKHLGRGVDPQSCKKCGYKFR
jgi:hypothetical protein